MSDGRPEHRSVVAQQQELLGYYADRSWRLGKSKCHTKPFVARLKSGQFHGAIPSKYIGTEHGWALAAHGFSTSSHPDTTREAGQISTDPDFEPGFIVFVGGGTGDLKSQIGRNEPRSGIIEGLARMGRRDPSMWGVVDLAA